MDGMKLDLNVHWDAEPICGENMCKVHEKNDVWGILSTHTRRLQ